ncbi:hypothetical protein N2152v2_003768 [Parachlorella kessleri]
MVGVTRKQQQQQQDSQQTFTVNRAEALAEIRADYDQNYFVSGAGAMKAYAPDCLFADPFTGFRGVQRFKKNVSNLGSLILDKKLDIYSWEEGEDSLKTKWRFSAVLDLPWKPLLAAGGSTTHVFDKETGLVVKHLEDWDADPGKVLRRLLRPAAKVPGTRWEAGMQALHDGDALGVWQALSPGVLRVTLVVAPLLLVVHLARGEGLPGLGGALLEDGCYLALVAAGVTELVKVVKHGDDIITVALKVLTQPDPHSKAEFTNLAAELWRQGLIREPGAGAVRLPPDRPARDDTKVKLVAPKDVPKRKKGGTLASRQALLHSLVHIENWAVDLAWDIIARFGQDPSYRLPRAFFDDFVTVAEDECRHFQLLEKRLEQTGSHYGALPAHDGLWESARETAGSLAARLAVEHCTHEARGLDVLPQTIHRFRSNGDEPSAALLEEVIYAEEISHCAAGVRWLRHLHAVALGMAAGQEAVGAGQGTAAPAAAAPAAAAAAAGDLSTAEPDPDPAAQHWEVEQRQQQPVQNGGCSAVQAVVAQLALTTARPEVQPAVFCACGTSQGGAGVCEDCSSDPADVADVVGRSPPAGVGSAMPQWAAEAASYPTVEAWFHALIRRHFRGPLKPPFNEQARAKAGFGPEWYLPLAQLPESGTAALPGVAAQATGGGAAAGVALQAGGGNGSFSQAAPLGDGEGVKGDGSGSPSGTTAAPTAAAPGHLPSVASLVWAPFQHTDSSPFQPWGQLPLPNSHNPMPAQQQQQQQPQQQQQVGIPSPASSQRPGRHFAQQAPVHVQQPLGPPPPRRNRSARVASAAAPVAPAAVAPPPPEGDPIENALKVANQFISLASLIAPQVAAPEPPAQGSPHAPGGAGAEGPPTQQAEQQQQQERQQLERQQMVRQLELVALLQREVLGKLRQEAQADMQLKQRLEAAGLWGGLCQATTAPGFVPTALQTQQGPTQPQPLPAHLAQAAPPQLPRAQPLQLPPRLEPPSLPAGLAAASEPLGAAVDLQRVALLLELAPLLANSSAALAGGAAPPPAFPRERRGS